MFNKYHYLSHSHNNAARVFIATMNDNICAFCSVLHLPHPIAKNIKKIHRLVVLPDYQGIGLGVIFLNEIAKIIINDGNRCTITTSAPSLINSLKINKTWNCTHFGRLMAKTGLLHGLNNKTSNSKNRITASFEYILK